MTTTAKKEKRERESDDHAHTHTHAHIKKKMALETKWEKMVVEQWTKKSTKILSFKPEDREEEKGERQKQTKDSAVPSIDHLKTKILKSFKNSINSFFLHTYWSCCCDCGWPVDIKSAGCGELTTQYAPGWPFAICNCCNCCTGNGNTNAAPVSCDDCI